MRRDVISRVLPPPLGRRYVHKASVNTDLMQRGVMTTEGDMAILPTASRAAWGHWSRVGERVPQPKVGAMLSRLSLLVVCAVSCTTAPNSDGSASIVGQVLDAAGGPWAGATVEVVCSASADTTRASTDTAGDFGFSLDFPNSIRGDQTTTTSCRFAVPNLTAPRAAVTQSITLYRSLQPTQRVALREGSIS